MPKEIPIEPKNEESLHFLNELPLFTDNSVESDLVGLANRLGI